MNLSATTVYMTQVWHSLYWYVYCRYKILHVKSELICVPCIKKKNEMKFQCYVSTMPQVSDFPAEQLLVAVFPGVPTAAELFLLPSKNQSEDKKKSEEELEQVWP